MKIIKQLLFSVLLPTLTIQTSLAGETWRTKLDVQASYGDYSSSKLRNNIRSVGTFLAVDYLDKAGFTLGYERTDVDYATGINSLTQNALYASVRTHLTPDRLPGKITLRVDGYNINNDDPTRGTDDGKIIAPQIAYLSANKRLYLDLGYAHSGYAGNLDIEQWTPTIGFGFNKNHEWVQLRGYFIDSSDADRTQGKNNTSALEAKLTHYFGPKRPFRLDRLLLTVLLGKRTYAVDYDAGAVYNLSDTQKGTLSLGSVWKLDDTWSLQLHGGVERYENRTISDDYSNRYVYLDIGSQW